MSLVQWLTRHFKAEPAGLGEFILQCPKCRKPKLYFSVSKRIGFCHYSRCPFHVLPVRLSMLAAAAGTEAPEPSQLDSQVAPSPTPQATECELPEAARPLVTRIDGVLMTQYPEVMHKVRERGVSSADQFQFDLRWDGFYVYIPVYFEGELVSYLGRAAWWRDFDIKRYNNAPGTNTNSYLFNWEEARHWPRLTLVENTFNAIWLRKVCHTVSTFGSTLSNEQAELIARCPFESVAILWDEGADKGAHKAMQKLKNRFGVPTAYGKIVGQPDEHDLPFLVKYVDQIHEAAKRGNQWVNLRECGS